MSDAPEIQKQELIVQHGDLLVHIPQMGATGLATLSLALGAALDALDAPVTDTYSRLMAAWPDAARERARAVLLLLSDKARDLGAQLCTAEERAAVQARFNACKSGVVH